MEFVKEAKDFFSERLRSPIFTSIGFVFLLLNWPALFNLVFGDTPVLERIEYFETHTNVCSKFLFPVTFGLMLAAIWPWIVFGGSKVVSRGVARTKEFQIEQAHNIQMKREELHGELQAKKDEIASEREKKIEEVARQRKKAVEEVGEETLLSVKEDFERREAEAKEDWEDWSDVEIASILFIATHGNGVNLDTAYDVPSSVMELLGHQDFVRARIELRDSLKKLETSGYVELIHNLNSGLWAKPTGEGYRLNDRLKSLRGL